MRNKLKCILLVDADEPTNYLNKKVLEEADCAASIKIAENGPSALSYLEDSDTESTEQPCPELIFLDINMPAMNGWEFLEKYSKLEAHHKANVVVVMLTTSLNPDDLTIANKIPDVKSFETKPLTKEKLDNLLNKYFPEVS